VSVHDVDVQNAAAAIDCGLRLSAKPREIGRQNRWCQFNQRGAPSFLSKAKRGPTAKKSATFMVEDSIIRAL
jgi:hypothetical protein